MKKLIKKRSDGVNETIRYNQWGQALGQEGTHLASMVGSLARKYIPINIDNWAQVPEEKKTFIWKIVLEIVFSIVPKMFISFVISLFSLHATIEVDPKVKKKILFDASKCWRNFKTNLTRDLVTKYKDDFPDLLKHPP